MVKEEVEGRITGCIIMICHRYRAISRIYYGSFKVMLAVWFHNFV